MNIPKTFQLAGVSWTVEQVKGMEDLGLCERDKALIILRKDLPREQKELTFFHELFHAIKYTQGDGGPHDEKEIDSLAYMLHQFLKTRQ